MPGRFDQAFACDEAAELAAPGHDTGRALSSPGEEGIQPRGGHVLRDHEGRRVHDAVQWQRVLGHGVVVAHEGRHRVDLPIVLGLERVGCESTGCLPRVADAPLAGPVDLQGGFQVRPRHDADARSALVDDGVAAGRAAVRRRLQAALDLADGRRGREDRLLGERVAQAQGQDAVQRPGRLTLEEGELFALDLLVVVPALVDGPVDDHGDADAEHHDRGQRKVVHALHNDQDHRQRHLLETAKHRSAANDAVHPGDCGDQPQLHAKGAHGPAKEASQQHGGGEGAPGHRQAREADVEREVGDEGQQA
mmetsp:Transcript_84816/g.240374  ORF Transcript_84816/g.240374 Transcript_84816/m.240374 type:complete len:307 (+) Transcript_84816:414-1334(+)